MPIPDHVVRFWRAADELAGTVTPTWWGAIVIDPRIPEIWDANYARVDLPTADVTADDVEAELVPALRTAGVGTLHVVSFYPDEHRALLADLSTRGHRLSWDLVMDLAEPGGRRSDVVVEELPPDAALWSRLTESFALFGIASADEADQLGRLEVRLTEGGKRWFGVRDGDGIVVSLAALLMLDGVGYVDNVATFPEARRRGYASAITARIAREARSAGAEHVILLADPDACDVVRMYERLGFRDVGKLGSTRGPLPDQSTNLYPSPRTVMRWLGLVRVDLDLLAEPLHVDVERLRVAEVVGAPDLLDQEVARQQPALASQERLEQLELLGRERDELAPHPDLVPGHVHLDRARP